MMPKSHLKTMLSALRLHVNPTAGLATASQARVSILLDVQRGLVEVIANRALTDVQKSKTIFSALGKFSPEDLHFMIIKDSFIFDGTRLRANPAAGHMSDAAINTGVKPFHCALQNNLAMTASLLLHLAGGSRQLIHVRAPSFLDYYHLVATNSIGHAPVYEAPHFTPGAITWIDGFRIAAQDALHFEVCKVQLLQELLICDSLSDAQKAQQINKLLAYYRYRPFEDAFREDVKQPPTKQMELYAITQGFGSINSPYRMAISLGLPLAFKALANCHYNSAFDLREFTAAWCWPNNSLAELLALIKANQHMATLDFTHVSSRPGYTAVKYQHTLKQAFEYCLQEQQSRGQLMAKGYRPPRI